jgi:hypothetical protein
MIVAMLGVLITLPSIIFKYKLWMILIIYFHMIT